jgi:decaprenyl-phosphate phosphoribosyltransferase
MSETAQTKVSFSRRLRAHLAIARLDHSIKNVFVLPGIIVPLSIYPGLLSWRLGLTLVWAFVSITLVACSNYVLNEVLDARPRRTGRQRLGWSTFPRLTRSGF